MHSRENLSKSIDAGLAPKFLLFWGHQPERDGSIGKGCLSQWYEAPFELEGKRFSTTEHWMMSEKARLFGDEKTREVILRAASPGEAKKLGRFVENFNESLWEEERVRIVLTANLAKFDQNPRLRDFLLKTGDKVLVEASPTDRIWGIGLGAEHIDAVHPSRWLGHNLLGFVLMEVRDQLRERAEAIS